MTTDDNRPSASGNTAMNETIEIAKTVIYALLIALVLRIFLFQPYTIPSASMEPNLFEGDYIIVSKYSYGYSKHSIPFSPPLFHGRIFDHAPTRGDIIVFKLPSQAASTRVDYIKRLIGMPGDRLQVKNGQVYINDKLLPWTAPPAKALAHLPPSVPPDCSTSAPDRHLETAPNGRQYIIQRFAGCTNANNTAVYTIPQHCYFMMGDNRDNSLDSRFDPEMPSTMTGTATCGWDPSVDAQAEAGESGVGFVPEEDLVGRARFVLLSWSPGASLFKPWTWFLNIRLNRFFHGLK